MTDFSASVMGLVYVLTAIFPNSPIFCALSVTVERLTIRVGTTPAGVTHAIPPMAWNVLWPVVVAMLKSALSNTNCVNPPRL